MPREDSSKKTPRPGEVIADLGGEEEVEKYKAFIHGFNAGLEFEQANRGADMDEDEFLDWLLKMYKARVQDDQ